MAACTEDSRPVGIATPRSIWHPRELLSSALAFSLQHLETGKLEQWNRARMTHWRCELSLPDMTSLGTALRYKL